MKSNPISMVAKSQRQMTARATEQKFSMEKVAELIRVYVSTVSRLMDSGKLAITSLADSDFYAYEYTCGTSSEGTPFPVSKFAFRVPCTWTTSTKIILCDEDMGQDLLRER